MGLHIPAGYALCSWLWSVTGDPQNMATTMGIDGTSGPITWQTVANELADRMTQAAAFPASTMANVYTYRGCRLVVNELGSTEHTIYDASRAVAGTNAVGPPPNNVALLVHKRTGVAGRIGRGRMYFPAGLFDEQSVDGVGNINASAVTTFQSRVNSLLGYTHPFVLLHSDTGAGAGRTPDPITQLVVDPKVATQRTRLRR